MTHLVTQQRADRAREIKRIAVNIRIRQAWLKVYAPGWSTSLAKELAGMGTAQWASYQSGRSGRVPGPEVQERLTVALGLQGCWLNADPECIIRHPVPEAWREQGGT
jgi:hypothetical protein